MRAQKVIERPLLTSPPVFALARAEWAAYLADNPESLEEFPVPSANPSSTRKDKSLASLFETSIPEEIVGFECVDRDVMEKIWPVGAEHAMEVRRRCIRDSPVADAAPDSRPLSRLALEHELPRTRLAALFRRQVRRRRVAH